MKGEVNISQVLNDLFSGYSFRSKVEHDPVGDLAVIQMKDLEDNYTRIGDGCNMIDALSIPPKYLLQNGDVLFISKGANNYAVVYDLELPKAAAASAFFILRPDTTKINPNYLAWYVNQKHVQQYLKENRAGTYIPNINRDTILGIQLSLPEIGVQNLIAKINSLSKREYYLNEKLTSLRKILINNVLIQKI
jgi:restriction endonuclease S subunit